MSTTDEHEPDPLSQHELRLLLLWRKDHEMPADAFARVRRGLVEPAPRSSRTTFVAIAALVAALVLLVLGGRWWERATPKPEADPRSLASDRPALGDAEGVASDRPAVVPAIPPATLPSTTPAVPAITPPKPAIAPRTKPRSDPERAPMSDAPPEAAIHASTLRDERELLTVAWSALKTHAPQRALQGVAAHRRRFPGGALIPERDAIAAIARCQTGPGSEADAFASRHPGSPLIERVRTACEEAARARDGKP